MHAMTAINVSAIVVMVILTAGFSAMGADMDCVNLVTRGGKHYCDPDSSQIDYKNRKNTSAEQTNTEAAAGAIQSLGNYLQNKSDQDDGQARQRRLEQERIELESQQRQTTEFQQNYQALDSFEASMEGNDWESRAAAVSTGTRSSKGKTPAQTSSTGECNCKEVAGICTATVVVVKKRKTGADFKVTSSAPRCSRVNYYIDNTPRLTVLNNTNTAMEHAPGLIEITNKSFEVESCQVCSSK